MPKPEALPAKTYADLIGKPFQAGGRDLNGLDCYGLVKLVLERNRQRIPDYPGVADARVNAGMILAAMETWQKLPGPAPGAVVAFRMDHRYPTHVALMLDQARFIHALEQTRVCIESVNSPLWQRRVVGFYRWEQESHQPEVRSTYGLPFTPTGWNPGEGH